MELSVVIPILNEEENIRPLYAQLREALEGLGRSYEIIVVDDGSTDHSFAILKELHERDEHLKVIRFRRNFGQTAAFAGGFDHSQGEVVVTMDADLQNDRAGIPMLLAKIEEGYDVVRGWRVGRQDPFLTRLSPSTVANWLISQVTGVHLHDCGCWLKAYRREVVKNVQLYGELHRFIPALASWMGISVAEVPVRHHPRHFGRSKYGLSPHRQGAFGPPHGAFPAQLLHPSHPHLRRAGAGGLRPGHRLGGLSLLCQVRPRPADG